MMYSISPVTTHKPKQRVTGHMQEQETLSVTIPSSGYIRRFRLAQHLGIHVATLDRWVRDKHIPSPVVGEKITLLMR